jgi:hypothetical protein
MKRFLSKNYQLLAVAGLLTLASCQKEEDAELQTTHTETVEAETLADMEFTAVDMYVEDAGNSETQLNGDTDVTNDGMPSCAIRTFNPETRTLTIDFGNTNCLCRDGHYRRGKIVAVFDGQHHTPGSKVTITLKDYFINDQSVKGTRVKTFLSPHKVNVTVRNASIETQRGTISWNATRTTERIAGTETRALADDVYLTVGRSEGVNRNGVAFQTVIEQPLKLVFDPTCVRNFVSGIVRTTTERGNTFVLNYDPIGGEPCDKIAALTVNGHSKQIVLR